MAKLGALCLCCPQKKLLRIPTLNVGLKVYPAMHYLRQQHFTRFRSLSRDTTATAAGRFSRDCALQEIRRLVPDLRRAVRFHEQERKGEGRVDTAKGKGLGTFEA
jgi:hypothetical protein